MSLIQKAMVSATINVHSCSKTLFGCRRKPRRPIMKECLDEEVGIEAEEVLVNFLAFLEHTAH